MQFPHPLVFALSPLLFAGSISGQSGVLESVKLGAQSGGLQGVIGYYDQFGASTTRLGDLDGDGVEDIAVGANYHDSVNLFEGEVFVLFLNTDGTVRAHHRIASGAGGFNTLLDGRDHFGTSVASLGDVDGDGTIELAVGAHRDDDGNFDAGAIYILSLSSDGSVQSEAKISATVGGFTATLDPYDLFASSLASLGDLNGDGLVELAVGAVSDDDGLAGSGAVYILSLRPDFSVQSHVKISLTSGGFGGDLRGGESFGSSIDAIGDLDGDGCVDLAVGAVADRGASGTGYLVGSLWILFLNADGSVRTELEIDDSTPALGGALGDVHLFGSDVARFEADATGARRVLVGASGGGGTTDTGAIWTLTLAPDGNVLAADEISGLIGGIDDVGSNDRLGSSVVNLGDVDQDGFPVIVAGGVGDSDGGNSTGAAWVFTLGPRSTQAVRNGAGSNPLCFSGSGPPLLGSVWTGTVDASVNVNAGLTIVAARAAPTNGIIIGAGELLVDVFTGGFIFDFFVTSSGATDVVMVGIPDDYAVAGLPVFLQAAVFGGGTGVLCNALDVVLGG